MQSPADSQTIEPDFNRMTKLQKLAALLTILGPESAAAVLKQMDEHEVEIISGEMSKIGLLGQDIQNQVLQEFSEVAIQASTSLRGGPEYTQVVLEKAVGMFKASNLLTRVAPTRPSTPVVDRLSQLEPREVLNLIKEEQPQTIALISSYLTPEKASELLALLRPDLRQQVVERLATLSPIPVESVERIVEVLLQKLGTKQTRALNHTGGIKYAADLLNALDKNISKSLLVSIEETNPELGQSIRAKMFTFEDIASLDMNALQTVMREVDMADLALALKTATEGTQAMLLSCISKRAAETVKEEMSFLGSVKARDVEAAQGRIIEVVRRLENQGDLDLSEIREKNRHELMA